MPQIKGIDISSYQGNISDLGSDIDFVVIKASEGTTYLNPNLAEQRDTARRDGKLVGYYHFADLSDAVAEAKHFVAAAGTLQPGEFLALDWEVGNYSDAIDQWAATFIQTVHGLTGVVPLLYSNEARIAAGTWPLTRATNAGLWEAAWGNTAPSATPWPFVAIWQNADNGSEQGVTGAVDTDIALMDRAHLALYGAGGSISAAPIVTPPAPQPAPAPAPAPTPQPQTYIVQSGDTLSAIAAKFGTTYQHLAAINGIADPNRIYAGQRLVVGGSPITRTYTVQKGDTLSGIAAKVGTTWEVLQHINRIANPNVIMPGQVLRLP